VYDHSKASIVRLKIGRVESVLKGEVEEI
jgi:hypothetical protein